MARIYGETIKNGFAEKLTELYPTIAIYKEIEDNEEVTFPNFFILQLTLDSEEDRKDHYFHNYYVTVRYREVADVALEDRIEQKLDKVSNNLITNLVEIPINNKPVKLRNCRTEKVDGVLHFFANVRVQVAKEKELQPKMASIEENIQVK